MLMILSKLSIKFKFLILQKLFQLPRLEAVFRCYFADVDGQAYSYDVYWYINEQSVITHKRIAYSNINQSLLRPADWVGQFRLA
jgi:hypothetical protein